MSRSLAASSPSGAVHPEPIRIARAQEQASAAAAVSAGRLGTRTGSPDSLHTAARKLLSIVARHAPARFTWGKLATLTGLKPSGGHFNAGRKDLRALGYVDEN